MAYKNSLEFNLTGVMPSLWKRGIKSPVISPLSMVAIVACSNFSAKACNSVLPSNSARYFKAPVQAKMVATELVEVSSPFKYL